jgi:hypothetical protein
MMRFTRSGLIALVFFAGCAVGGASSHLVSPAEAYKGPKWQYRCFELGDFGDDKDVEENGNKLGAQGYEMVGASGDVWCFKRPQ